MYKQTIDLPLIFQVNEGVIEQVPLFLYRNNIEFKKLAIVSGINSSIKFAHIILNTIDALHYKLNRQESNPVEELMEFCSANGIDLLIGVGGGFVLDVVKRVSLLAKIENLLVPTIISNDGLISPIAVIPDQNGKTHSLPGKMPLGVVVDINIIRKAPVKFLQAAAGDILSNISATNDWVHAYKHGGESINDLAYMLSRSSALSLIHHESKDIRNRNFLKQVVSCQISSGLAMALAGSSRPCSGSEHLISHAIDANGLSEDTLHGYQVGSISIFCLYLQKKLDVKCINYAHELEIPIAFHKLNNNIYDDLQDVYEKALVMRPGRYTILDEYKGMKFEDAYNEFLVFLQRFKI
ncbi:MAG: iron-containing alcohol dehydrogenase family protein [Adhaeribacter sp.]